MSGATTEFVYVSYIRATREKVFEALVRPEVARKYWGHENVSDWEPGSKWEHVRVQGGRQVELAGEVLEIEPPRRLVISWANASEYEDASRHSRVTFELATLGEMVRLTVTHDRLVPDSGMAQGIRKGWPLVLASLKSYLETGQALDVFAERRAG
ncbi:SRPBCC family protein [Pseudohoeflea coraliihabitans]|uniref:SRPBCC family protein n=1 Tax=Pseudohoeflea coraliihabitans TaxID=2860393 RepID=A0ABS6WN17_9HYPH|nr:SRPBCC family protein [Pseudohoeflea sp. DP4N28-3]MBW3096807.1 SRPBCC family protein [Pseudohoeflea sp. DP4N28-3]